MPTDLEITREPPSSLATYAEVPIAFTADRVLEVVAAPGEPGGARLTTRQVDRFVKDYDALAEHHPRDWAERFDLSGWGILAARIDGRRVGGAVIARGPIDLLDSTDDALLWDLRVAPEVRGRGVGAALFRAAEAWAREHGATRLVVETQNVNAAACRFYRSQGCVLAAFDRFAYADLPDEVQLLWHRDLTSRRVMLPSMPEPRSAG